MRGLAGIATALLMLACGAMVSPAASAFTVTQDGVGINVFYTRSGQTLSFHFQADFTGTVTGNWLGSYMDQLGLQFGDGNNNGTSIISTYTSPLTSSGTPGTTGYTNTSGTWTGYTDKAGGNDPCVVGSAADAICYQLDPGGRGIAGDQIIAAAVYDWYFDVTFKNGVDLDAILGSARSIKFQAFRFDGKVAGKCDGTFADPDCWKNGGQFSQSGVFTGDDDDGDDDDQDVPEPGTLALLGLGLIGLGASRRRRA